MQIATFPLMNVRSSTGPRRAVVVSVNDDGHTYHRYFYSDREHEDFEVSSTPSGSGLNRLANGFPALIVEQYFSDAWGWIRDEALSFIANGTYASRRALAAVAKSL